MPNKISRRWDQKGRGNVSLPETGVQNDFPVSCEEVPFIEVDGCKYFSDRFYLHRTLLDDTQQSATMNTTSTLQSRAFNMYNANCMCGARKAPPLLDRERLVSSLDLVCAIFSSYTIDLVWMKQAFPNIWAAVPTLLLHGQRGLTSKLITQSKKKNQKDQGDDDSDDSSVEESSSEQVESDTMLNDFSLDELGPKFHLTQIRPIWLPRSHQPPRSKEGSWRQLHPNLKEKLLATKGVHHPKFFIGFCKDKSVVVLVSTGNWTRPKSTDGSWLQRFLPAASSLPKSKQKIRDGSDFGFVLADFLQNQSYAAEELGMLPEEFLNRYMCYSSLDDLERNYDWKSQVHLIATIPGDHDGRTSCRHLSKTTIGRELLYGRQRIADIVSRLARDFKQPRLEFQDWSNKAWFPPALLSIFDTLIAQPTSIGAGWRQTEISNVVRSYLAHDDKDMDAAKGKPTTKKRTRDWCDIDRSWSDQELVERLRIVWPTRNFMKTIANCEKADINDSNETTDKNYLFMSSKTFNSIETACLSHFVMFEPSIPEQKIPSTPHIKSYARLFEGDDRDLREAYDVRKAENYFSWFHLTSACLSHGAQGNISEDIGNVDNRLSYTNFELGVMFCSRLQGNADTDRIYCFKPAQCMCTHSMTGYRGDTTTLIHLPIPYCLYGTPYQLVKDETEFVETPFLHEIERSEATTGNMKLTPYGRSAAASVSYE